MTGFLPTNSYFQATSATFAYSLSTPKSFLDSFKAMFSVNCPSPRAWERVGEPMLKIGGRGSNARKCLSARTEILNPKNDLGVDKLYIYLSLLRSIVGPVVFISYESLKI